jgi:hypothetical protein
MKSREIAARCLAARCIAMLGGALLAALAGT